MMNYIVFFMYFYLLNEYHKTNTVYIPESNNCKYIYNTVDIKYPFQYMIIRYKYDECPLAPRLRHFTPGEI